MVAALSDDERAALAAHTAADLDNDALERFFRAGPTGEHEAQLRAAGVTCVAVVEEAADRHVTLGAFGQEHGWVTTAQHALLDEYPRSPRTPRSRGAARCLGPAPTLGEHTDAVVAEFGAATRTRTTCSLCVIPTPAS